MPGEEVKTYKFENRVVGNVEVSGTEQTGWTVKLNGTKLDGTTFQLWNLPAGRGEGPISSGLRMQGASEDTIRSINSQFNKMANQEREAQKGPKATVGGPQP